MKRFLVFPLLFLTFATYADSGYDSLKTIVKKDLDLLAVYDYSNPEYEQLDVDSVSALTAKRIVKLLSYKESFELKSNPLNNLTLTASYGDSLIRIYKFVYSSGGTRGSVNHSIIQWKKSNGNPGSYNLNKYILSSFDELYKLKSENKNLFLMIGYETASSSQMYATAFVIQFNKDYLILDYHALFGMPYITYVNSDLYFDEKNQLLKIESMGNLVFKIPPDKNRKEEEEKMLLKRISECFSEEGVCKLKFDGNKFNQQ